MGRTYTRIYDTRIKKFLILLGISVPLMFGIFQFLAIRGDIEVTGYSGDMTCAGTLDDPCYAYLNFSMNKDYIYVYPSEEWYFSTDKKMEKIEFQVRDRRYKTGWRTVDLTKPSPYCQRTGCKYAFRFYKTKGLWEIRIVGYKINPYEDIKWSFGEIDPTWVGKRDIYTTNSETHCDELGKCTLTLYSGTRYVYEDDIWKKIEDAKSLKDVWKKFYLEKDKDFDIEILEVNYTYLELNFTFNSSNWQQYPECVDSKENDIKCDFKLSVKEEVCYENETCEKVETKFQYKYQLKDGKLKEDLKYNEKDNPLGKEYIFGGNSTTISLQTADSQNLEDTYIDGNNADTNYGANTALQAGVVGVEEQETYMKLNLSSIPSGKVIDDGVLQLRTQVIGGCDVDTVIQVFNSSNQTWVEEYPTWNNRNMFSDSLINSSSCSGNNVWQHWNVTNATNTAYIANEANITFILNRSSGSSYNKYCSKEYATTAFRPMLNITYSEEETPYTCDYTSGTWEVDCASQCVNRSINVTGDLRIYSSATGNATFTDINVEGSVYENYTDSCYVYWFGFRNITG